MSIWYFNSQRSAIECEHLFERGSGRHSSGLSLAATTYPDYFEALESLEIIAADDAVTDPCTREFAEDYLKPLDIGAMLDVPIKLKGKKVGVLCLEHLGPSRPWTSDEKTFALAMSHLISLASEQEQRRQAEVALRKSEAQLSSALKMALLGHWELDVATGLFTFTDHFYDLLRTTAEREGGYSMPAEEYARRFLPPEALELVATETEKALQTTDPNYCSQLEHPIMFGDGRAGYVTVQIFVVKDALGRTIKTYGVNQDISERKTAEEAIRRAEHHFRSLIEHSGDGIRLVDRDLRIVYASPSVSAIEGFSADELLGNHVMENTHPEDRSMVEELLEKMMSNPGVPFPITWRRRHKDGHWLWLEGVATNLLEDPAVGAIVKNYRDVSSRIRLEKQLLQSHKLEAIGQLAGGVAHDFNNLLTVIQGYASLLMEQDDSMVKEAATEIVESSKQAAALTRQLLAFSLRQVMLPAPLDLNNCVMGLSAMLQRLLGESIGIETILHPYPLMTRADSGMLDQILLNLAVNSREAMPEGGTFSIATGEKTFSPEEASILLNTSPGKYVYLRVSDTGCGIPRAELSKIFDPFFTTKHGTRASGLGLSSVFGIVKQHGGDIAVQSAEKQGTTFDIYLPVLDSVESPKPHTTPAIQKMDFAGGPETILLAEDEASVRRLTKTVLQRAGYRVLEAAHATEAMKIYEEHKDEIQLLFTDIVMPGGVSGLQLAADLRQRDSNLKIIFTSGYSADVAGREFTLEEGQNFLPKPVPLPQLLATVRRCLDDDTSAKDARKK